MRQVAPELSPTDGILQFLSEIFDRRTLLDMEAALDRACEELPAGQHDHDNRTFIANRIIECVIGGTPTEGAMTHAAREAVAELAQRQVSLQR